MISKLFYKLKYQCVCVPLESRKRMVQLFSQFVGLCYIGTVVVVRGKVVTQPPSTLLGVMASRKMPPSSLSKSILLDFNNGLLRGKLVRRNLNNLQIYSSRDRWDVLIVKFRFFVLCRSCFKLFFTSHTTLEVSRGT